VLRRLGYTGLKPHAYPLTLVRIVCQLKRGQLTQIELGEGTLMKSSMDISILYIGHAIKDAGTERC
jgi:hypothetical protein